MIDPKGIELLTDIFKTRYDIDCKFTDVCGMNAGVNSLLNVLPKGHVFRVNFYWSPLNRNVYEEQKPLSTDIPDLVNHNKSIQAYLEQQIHEPLKSKSNEFVPVLTKRIDDLCKTWLKFVKEKANESNESSEHCFTVEKKQPRKFIDPSYPDTLEGVDLLDREGIKLLTDIFKARYDIECTYTDVWEKSIGVNSLLDVLSKGRLYKVNFYWSPLNPNVYGKSEKAKETNPES